MEEQRHADVGCHINESSKHTVHVDVPTQVGRVQGQGVERQKYDVPVELQVY